MTRQQHTQLMNERAQHLLRVLIDRYIREGEPVGSRTLARDSRLDLSPATVRNVMSDLEEMGFVAAPHTSAGRIPTAQGYRLFVDSLLNIQPLNSNQVEELRQHLGAEADSAHLIETASNLLSDITRMAGVVTLPRHEHVALRRIDFLPLSQNRILVILVINEKEVQNRIIQTDRTFSASELETIANFLNAHFAGKDIHEVRTHLIEEMQQTRQDMNDLMLSVVSVAEKVFGGEDTPSDEDYVLAGQTNLMQFRELSDVDKLRELFEAFNRKRDILHLLDQCICANGVQLFIGEESGYQVLDECSLVTAPYSAEGEVIGVLGVIGPTRMAYDRIIPIVDATARLLGAALNSKS